MKKSNLFLLSLILFLLSCNQDQSSNKEVNISGKIDHPSADSVWIRFYDPLQEMTSYSAAIDSTGSFDLNFPLAEASEAQFYDGNETSVMFLEPGDELLMSLDTEAFDESISYQGEGSCANNYLTAYYLKFKDPEGAFNPFEKLRDTDTEAVMKYVDSLYNAQVKDYETYLQENECSDAFKNWLVNDVLFEKANYYTNHLYAKMRAVNYQLDSLEMPPDFYEEYESMIDLVDTGRPSRTMYNHLRSYFYHLTRTHADRYAEGGSKDSVNILLIKENYPQEYGQVQMTNYFLGQFKNFKTQSYEDMQEMISDYITDAELLNTLNRKLDEINALYNSDVPEGTMLIDLNMPEYDKTSFDELINKYKGQVIYLDFWASWCGPCKAEMPFSHKLKEKLDTDEVAFVYLSTDKDSTAWINMIKMLEMEGDQYRLSPKIRKESDAIFNVRFIPRYIVYDKDGAVVDSAASRPSDPKTYELLKSLL
ncbi:MAG: TlpA disulfide reductase family protein [Bacteroidota bacterium]|nr:TlpA disulfide reductase family protein [Bacteroidota bacterium]